MRRPVNPYVAGTPLRGKKGFFGRQDALEWIARELENPSTNSLVISGQRRIGKTSLLLQLERTLPVDQFLPVYFDLQDQATRPLAQVLVELADTIAARSGLETPDPDAFDDQGHFLHRSFLPQLYQSLGDHRRPVLLLDEFDVIDQRIGPELPETAAAKTLLPLLRRTMAEHPRLALVFAIGRRAQDLSLDLTSTFRTSLVREIWVLDPPSTREVIGQAEVNGTLCFTDQAGKRILSLTSGHPYFTQLLCQRIWERAYTKNPQEPPHIETADVEAAVPDALQAGDQALLWLWRGLSPSERIYAAAMAEIAGRGQTTSHQDVIQLLTAHAARLRTREVEQAPKELARRQILAAVGEQRYRFTIEFFRRWVRESKPLYTTKEELDHVEPVAERLYDLGREYFERHQWETAARFFRQALEANPRHFRARLHLGETLLELGQTDAAVTELEQAHDLDENEAKFALARAVARKRQATNAPLLLIDDERDRVYLGSQEIRLSRLEHAVLRVLGQSIGQVVTKQTLNRATRSGKNSTAASVDAAIYRLRKKLGDNAQNPTYLETRRGLGYVLHTATYIPPAEKPS